jgi:hypothetical protein
LPGSNGQPDNIASALADVSDRVTQLVHDEIELAKAEVAEKAKSLAVGAGLIAAGAVFGVFAVIFVLLTLAWGLDSLIANGFGQVWIGFAIVLALLLVATVASVLIAKKLFGRGAPKPTMAIDEAKKIRATVSASKGSDR